MVDKPQANDPAAGASPAGSANPPRRAPGHRGNDMRDTVAELTERAHLISQEAGGKVAAAMKDVISAGAGIAGFAIESARDLVQFMVRRGQMTAEEADKLIREAEAAHDKRPASEKARPTASRIAADRAAAAKAEAAARAAAAAAALPSHRTAVRPVVPPAVPPVPPAAKSAPAKSSVKAAAKPASSSSKPKPTAKAATKLAAKTPAKPAAKKAPATAQKTKPAAKKKKR
jgi:polyhydroxyalkanoate synthesis regulator phasin